MAENFPQNIKEIFDDLATDFKQNLPVSNPTLKKSWLRALLMTIAGLGFDIYTRLKELKKSLFSVSAEDDDLINIAFPWIGNKIAATIATGYVTIVGTLGTTIPKNTVIQTNTIQYETLSEVKIASNVQTISTLVYSSGIATAIFESEHKYASGMEIVISGATPTSLNGTFTITVTGSTTFNYDTTETGSGTATGTIQSTSLFASVQVNSLEKGEDKNQTAGTELQPLSPISGVSDIYVQYSEIVGGTDLESNDEYRDRLNYRLQNPVANFNEAAIVNKINELKFVKRIFVESITPSVGMVTIYNLKENNELPTSTELTIIKNKILEIKPVTTSDDYIIVKAPTLVPTDFVFASISPSTSTMKQAIINSLTAFFETEPDISTIITKSQYTNAVINTIDESTGDKLVDFNINFPSGNIYINDGEIGTLGNVNFI